MFGIHREGRTTIIVVCALIVLFGLGLLYFVTQPWRSLFAAVLLVVLLLVVYFFRDPYRKISNQNASDITSPCDGKVVVIEQVMESEHLNTMCTQISIFMSPLNVHINWYPCNGKVTYTKYHQGKYLVAWHPKSSLENERTTTVISNNGVPILVRQIAGAVARRIITYAKPEQQVKRGEELGFIRFGSRVDLFVPLEATVRVSLDEVVKGGQSILAVLPD